MKEALLNSITDKIKNYYHYDNKKILEIRYGLETIYVSIVKILVVFIVSIFIHTTKELCIFYLSYAILRLFGFGLHAKNTLQCWILTIPIFVLIPYLIKNITINSNCYYLVILFLLLITIYAPADTEKRPLINIKKRRIFKVLTVITSIIYLIIIVLSKNYLIKNSLSFAIILESIVILPISYKLLGLKYANYKSYRRKEVT